VNASGQFCGVAEMLTPVDFTRSVDYWQQDKWNGHFQVKWHVIKDVPNSQFRHIIIASNDGKPVTNSRDTQEVPLQQGQEMLRLFKGYSSRTSILDDFNFYDSRQRAMQERKTRHPSHPFPHQQHSQHLQHQQQQHQQQQQQHQQQQMQHQHPNQQQQMQHQHMQQQQQQHQQHQQQLQQQRRIVVGRNAGPVLLPQVCSASPGVFCFPRCVLLPQVCSAAPGVFCFPRCVLLPQVCSASPKSQEVVGRNPGPVLLPHVYFSCPSFLLDPITRIPFSTPLPLPFPIPIPLPQPFVPPSSPPPHHPFPPLMTLSPINPKPYTDVASYSLPITFPSSIPITFPSPIPLTFPSSIPLPLFLYSPVYLFPCSNAPHFPCPTLPPTPRFSQPRLDARPLEYPFPPLMPLGPINPAFGPAGLPLPANAAPGAAVGAAGAAAAGGGFGGHGRMMYSHTGPVGAAPGAGRGRGGRGGVGAGGGGGSGGGTAGLGLGVVGGGGAGGVSSSASALASMLPASVMPSPTPAAASAAAAIGDGEKVGAAASGAATAGAGAGTESGGAAGGGKQGGEGEKAGGKGGETAAAIVEGVAALSLGKGKCLEWLQSLVTLFKADLTDEILPGIDKRRAEKELRMFTSVLAASTKGERRFHAGLTAMLKTPDWRDNYPNLVLLWVAVAVLPLSTVECERGFSRQNIIKSWKRSALKDARLGDLMCMSLMDYTPDWDEIVTVWRSYKKRKPQSNAPLPPAGKQHNKKGREEDEEMDVVDLEDEQDAVDSDDDDGFNE
ncbi:unnamed protein product, partial [Closterium sp. NIES-54]